MPNDSDVGSESGVESERSRLLHTWGPSALIVTVVLAVVAWVLTTEPLAVSGTARENIAGANSVSEMRLAPEVIPWAAEAAGTTASIDWGARCDTTTGKLAMPTLAGPCFAPFTGDNGGATSVGVTATSIKVVAYQTNPNDTMAALVSGAAPGTTDRDANFRTQQRYIEILSTYFETYGRHVELVGFTGTGQITDPVSAAADAETIARDLEPFAVIGGPLLTNAFADTLASRKVLCFNCTPGQPSSFYAKRSPYVWDTGIGPEQAGLLLNEFLGKQLNGRPAAHAGDPAMVAVPRVFGSLHITLGPDTQEIAAIQQADLATYGVSYATEVTFASPLDIASQGREMITRLKEAGVTTVVYVGDAFSVISLTKIATEQGYFPEWVIGGTALVDTAVIPRLYDQRQWAHAFGLASIPVRRADGSNATIDLYTWFFGSPPPQPGGSAALLFIPVVTLMSAIQLAGAGLTPDRVRDVLFQSPVVSGLGSTTYGDRGIWPSTDYTGGDDMGVVWWDPAATGPDELGGNGDGLYRYIGGEQRYLPRSMPTVELPLFDPAQAVTEVATAPLGTFQPLR